MSDVQNGGLWNNLGALTNVQLAALVDTTITVLEGREAAFREPDTESVKELPPGALAAELASALKSRGVLADTAAAAGVAKDAEASRAVAVALLESIRQFPVLAEEIEAAYEARKQLLFVDPATLAAAALLLLVLKLKKVHVGKDGTEVEFSEAPKGALGIVRSVLGL